jgi:hypothetical protein
MEREPFRFKEGGDHGGGGMEEGITSEVRLNRFGCFDLRLEQIGRRNGSIWLAFGRRMRTMLLWSCTSVGEEDLEPGMIRRIDLAFESSVSPRNFRSKRLGCGGH